jgi:hypothetical protein
MHTLHSDVADSGVLNGIPINGTRFWYSFFRLSDGTFYFANYPLIHFTVALSQKDMSAN